MNANPVASPKQLPVSIDLVISILGEIIAERGDGRPQITRDSRLDELALASLEMVELFIALEDMAGYELDPASSEGLVTVSDLLLIRPA